MANTIEKFGVDEEDITIKPPLPQMKKAQATDKPKPETKKPKEQERS